MSYPYPITITGISGWSLPGEEPRGGFTIHWEAKGIGFGTLSVEMRRGTGGVIEVDDEYMSPNFVEALFRELTSQGKHRGEKD